MSKVIGWDCYETWSVPVCWDVNDKGYPRGKIITIDDPIGEGDGIVIPILNGPPMFMKVDGDMTASNDTYTAKLGIAHQNFVVDKLEKK